MNKKGSIGDVFFISVFIFLLAIVFVVGWVIHSKVNDEFQNNPSIVDQGKTMMQNSTDDYISLFDGIFLTIIVGLWIGTIILAFQIDIHPVFFVLTIIVFAILVILTALFGNAFYTFANNANIVSYADDFTIIPFVMNNFVTVMIVLGFSVALVMYAKTT